MLQHETALRLLRRLQPFPPVITLGTNESHHLKTYCYGTLLKDFRFDIFSELFTFQRSQLFPYIFCKLTLSTPDR
jgi:hypothetical protein